MHLSISSQLLFLGALCITAVLADLDASATSNFGGRNNVNPIVFFPGYSLSYMQVTVNNGKIAGCPTHGSYVLGFGLTIPQNGFSYKCMMDYVNLTYTPHNPPGKIWVDRPDVSIVIPGREQGIFSQCVVPVGAGYDTFYPFMLSHGYTANTLLAACYDWRIDPVNDAIAGPGFIQNTMNVVMRAYANGGGKRVYLIAHSNGPIMALAFLNAMTQEWKDFYLEGFISLSGNFAGQGLAAAIAVAGLSIQDFSFNPDTDNVWPYLSEVYYSMPRPYVYQQPGNAVNLLTVTDIHRTFTSDPSDVDDMFRLAGMPFSQQHWRDYVQIAGTATPPNIRTWAFWGTNISTAVGIVIPSFSNRNPTDFIMVDGDGNQEDQDNRACKVWAHTMNPGCFSYQEIPNLYHFNEASDPYILSQILGIVSQTHTPLCCNSFWH